MRGGGRTRRAGAPSPCTTSSARLPHVLGGGHDLGAGGGELVVGDARVRRRRRPRPAPCTPQRRQLAHAVGGEGHPVLVALALTGYADRHDHGPQSAVAPGGPRFLCARALLARGGTGNRCVGAQFRGKGWAGWGPWLSNAPRLALRIGERRVDHGDAPRSHDRSALALRRPRRRPCTRRHRGRSRRRGGRRRSPATAPAPSNRTSAPPCSTGPPPGSPIPTCRRLSPARSPRRRPSPSARPGSRPPGPSTRSASPPPRPARWPARWCPSTRRARPGSGKLGFVLRVPIGVVAAISPFNFPLNLVAHKIAPAIAAGCPVVLKPASATPLTALRLANLLLDECGLPAGLAQRRGLLGPRWLTTWSPTPTSQLITFTGSPEVGWGIRARGAAGEGGPRARQQRAAHRRARRRPGRRWRPR